MWTSTARWAGQHHRLGALDSSASSIRWARACAVHHCSRGFDVTVTSLPPPPLPIHPQAACNAIDAGFDGVEIHGANGYLIGELVIVRDARVQSPCKVAACHMHHAGLRSHRVYRMPNQSICVTVPCKGGNQQQHQQPHTCVSAHLPTKSAQSTDPVLQTSS